MWWGGVVLSLQSPLAMGLYIYTYCIAIHIVQVRCKIHTVLHQTVNEMLFVFVQRLLEAFKLLIGDLVQFIFHLETPSPHS